MIDERNIREYAIRTYYDTGSRLSYVNITDIWKTTSPHKNQHRRPSIWLAQRATKSLLQARAEQLELPMTATYAIVNSRDVDSGVWLERNIVPYYVFWMSPELPTLLLTILSSDTYITEEGIKYD